MPSMLIPMGKPMTVTEVQSWFRDHPSPNGEICVDEAMLDLMARGYVIAKWMNGQPYFEPSHLIGKTHRALQKTI